MQCSTLKELPGEVFHACAIVVCVCVYIFFFFVTRKGIVTKASCRKKKSLASQQCSSDEMSDRKRKLDLGGGDSRSKVRYTFNVQCCV